MRSRGVIRPRKEEEDEDKCCLSYKPVCSYWWCARCWCGKVGRLQVLLCGRWRTRAASSPVALQLLTLSYITAMPMPDTSPPRRRLQNSLRLVLLSLTTISNLAFLFPSSVRSPSLLPRPTTHLSVYLNTLPRPDVATALAAATGTGNDNLPDRLPVVAIIGHPGSGQTTFARYFLQARDKTAPRSLPPSLPPSLWAYICIHCRYI